MKLEENAMSIGADLPFIASWRGGNYEYSTADGILTIDPPLDRTMGSCCIGLPRNALFDGSLAGFYFTIMFSASKGRLFKELRWEGK
jgi:hypothetical protein